MDANNYLSASFLDILFEGKNKQYGAYELRTRYHKRLRNALIATVALCLAFITTYAVANYINSKSALHDRPVATDIKLKKVDIPDTHKTPPPPLPPPAPEPPKIRPQVQFTPPKVIEDKNVRPEEQPPDLNKIQNRVISIQTLAGDSAGIDPELVPDKGTGIVETAPEKTTVFISVEQMPSFPGGISALMKYLRDHIHYPAVARENGIQGTIVVQFIVSPDGSISKVETMGAKKGGGLEEEAMRVVKGMPKWKPGKQNGRTVTVQFHLPVRFTLQ